MKSAYRPAQSLGALRGGAQLEGVAGDAERLQLRGELSPLGHFKSIRHTPQAEGLEDDQSGLLYLGMAEVLPGIDIAVSVNPVLFLKRMADLGHQAGKFKVERHSTSLGERRMDIVNFRLQTKSVHEGDGFQLIAQDERSMRVNVEARAYHWSPDPPTKAVYVEAARDLAGNLLKQYNQAYGTRHRLRIAQRMDIPFRMTERTATLLKRFTVLANTSSLHFYDWQRFYALALEGRQEIPDYVFRSLLIEAGFSSVRAAELAEIYMHLWAFKRMR